MAKKKTIAQRAIANGIKPQTAYARIKKGESISQATTRPTHKRVPKHSHGTKQEAVWQYLVENPLAKPTEVALETGVSYQYAYFLMRKVGTPREVFEREADAAMEISTDDRSNSMRNVMLWLAIAGVVAIWVVYALGS